MFQKSRRYWEKRRDQLKTRVERLERLEERNTITEPISVLGLSLAAMRGLRNLGLVDPSALSNAPNVLALVERAKEQGQGRPNPAGTAPTNLVPIVIGPPVRADASAAGRAMPAAGAGSASPARSKGQSDDWLTVNGSPGSNSSETGISQPWHPISPAAGGGALPPRGGSSAIRGTGSAAHGAIMPLNVPRSSPGASSAGGSAALLAAAAATGAGAGSSASNSPGGAVAGSPVHGGLSGKGSHGGSSAPNSGGHGVALVSSGGGPGRTSSTHPATGRGRHRRHSRTFHYMFWTMITVSCYSLGYSSRQPCAATST